MMIFYRDNRRHAEAVAAVERLGLPQVLYRDTKHFTGAREYEWKVKRINQAGIPYERIYALEGSRNLDLIQQTYAETDTEVVVVPVEEESEKSGDHGRDGKRSQRKQ